MAKDKKVEQRVAAATSEELRGKKPISKTVTIYLDDEAIERISEARRELEVARRLLRPSPVKPDVKDMSAREKATAEKRYNDAAEAAERARERFEKAEAELAEAQEALKEHARTLTFRSLGRKRFEALQREYPLSEEDAQEFEDAGQPNPGFDADALAPALIQESAASPKLSKDDVEYIWENWNVSELMELFNAAMYANTAKRTAEMGNS